VRWPPGSSMMECGAAPEPAPLARFTWKQALGLAGGFLLRMLTETIASGYGSRPTGDVEKVTGSAPTDFTDFAHRTAAAWSKETAR
ncbi:hypothetical protein ACFXG4_40560, partial [Nocardia sp. NPDC059246]